MQHGRKVRLLYKTLLRLHRGLPEALQELGNNYVKEEFKRHKNCSVAESQLFINEWAEYALILAEQLGLRGKPKPVGMIGANLSQKQLQYFRDEQLSQLYELLQEAKR
ncbi:succinate dehydrogenase assembly factor 3, mitochondrial [Anopheles bellator]|uniref:succinate dehydrogenase assembly factor 3, mitochondrial n=1 Tax=Anopheles bellator TaxID=139047 RepID=UPI002649EC1B|nr:succinate dehydrogenase assembly factor 3, mitochondrial [Anopheles bellator]XP_058057467.1 succinate dehydrogenase assembly factor 3, mitochondrial [Anopheles bellator]XP_058057468.1 succinate dehydrogenase assembly factor 3, mitochondrial [Anopheles bellator]